MGREGGGICTTCAHLSPSLHIPPLAPPPPRTAVRLGVPLPELGDQLEA